MSRAGVGNASKKAQKGRGAPRNAQDPGDELKGWVDSLFKCDGSLLTRPWPLLAPQSLPRTAAVSVCVMNLLLLL